jgi:hypothetical protein
MRKDMAKLIVKGHSRPKDRSNSTKCKERDWENAPERGKMREPDYGWSDGPIDHLNPLFNFLKSNVGRPWAKVYSEICAVADARSFAGKHLREHIDGWVFSEEELIARLGRRWWYRGYRDFYYDSKGILRRWGNENERRKSYWKDRQDPNKCYIDNRPYVRINGCWFEGEYYTIPTEKLEYQYVPGERKMQLLPKQYVRSVKQLNKKELKALGLSNEPGWKWYEQSK